MSSHDETHAELGRTVDELVQWLHVVEVGLSSLLDKTVTASSNHWGDGDPGREDEHTEAGDEYLEEYLQSEDYGIGMSLDQFLELDGDEISSDGDIRTIPNWDDPSGLHFTGAEKQHAVNT